MSDVDPKDPKSESHFMSISVRAWLAVFLVLTVCTMSIFKIDIKEPLYTLVVMAVSFYLGKSQPTAPNADAPKSP